MELDRLYVETRCFLLDLAILLNHFLAKIIHDLFPRRFPRFDHLPGQKIKINERRTQFSKDS
jgi:hypothetical protein